MATDRPERRIPSSKGVVIEPVSYSFLKAEFPIVGQALFEPDESDMGRHPFVCEHFWFRATALAVTKQLIRRRKIASPECRVGAK